MVLAEFSDWSEEMAWYAEVKRRKWYCINEVDMITAYRQKLYDDWYDSLTDVQKQQLEEHRREEEEKRKRDGEMALARLEMMSIIMSGAMHGNMGNYIKTLKELLRE